MKYSIALLSAFFQLSAGAQTSNVINTAVPFLRLSPDACASSLGNTGIARPQDIHSIFWNTAKLGFIKDEFGASLSYTPWLTELPNNIFLGDISAYWKIDSLNAVTLSFRDFSLGQITFTDSAGNILEDFHPNEYTVHAGYARRLSKHFSTGINLGYVRSTLGNDVKVNNLELQPGSTMMMDISLFYTKRVKSLWFKEYDLGLTVSNLGGKISYTGDPSNGDFLPANLGLGSNFNFQFGKNHQLTCDLDLNKLLVPTPDSSGAYRNESVLEGLWQSWSDAPDGFDEELAEVTVATGIEYAFKNLVSLRSGFFYEAKTKGARQFFTMGAGVKYWLLQFDVGYVIPTGKSNSPLDRIFSFGLSCNVNSFKQNKSRS